MHHQDLDIINIGSGKKINQNDKKIKKHTPNLEFIKIENETDNFQIKKIPKALSQEIIHARNTKKITQKDLSNRINVQKDMINSIENGKALYNSRTKEIINKIQKYLGVKFQNK